MHRACTNNPLKSDRRNWMTGQENQCRRILSLSLQKATVPSDEIGSSSDCENRTMVWNHLEQSSKEGPDATENRLGGSWVSHVPWQSNVSKRVQVRPGDQPGYPKDTIESFVGHSSMGLLCPPANIVQNLEDTNQTINQTKGSFTSVQMVHTHTETRACRITVRTVQPFPVSCQRCVKDMCLMQRSSQAWDWWTLVCRNHLRHLRLVDSGWCIWCMRGT